MTLISRRQFNRGLIAVGGAALSGKVADAAEFSMRQFHNQPAESPLHQSLVAMWAAVKEETQGRVEVQTFPENDHTAGGDPAVLTMLIDGNLDFFTLNGGLIGAVVPAVNVQAIPFAFQNLQQVFTAMDGELGDYLRQEMRAKGIYALPRGCFDNGFQQLSITSKPVRTVADMQGMKIRTPNTAIYIEAFQALGATPVPINIDKLYDALKAHDVDAQTNPLTIIELFKLYEVQKYVSLTSHLWAGFNLMASLKRWESLPAGVRELIERNAAKYVQMQRKENAALNGSLQSKLTEQGMMFNEADTHSFRSRLGPFYANWKEKVGAKTWALLEAQVGRLA
jgi:tripartite ATP-independent transporter DctP family solute receptor